MFGFDGVRPENLDFEGAIAFHEEMREMMNFHNIPFIVITLEDLQERIDFVRDEILKRWPNVKLDQSNRIPEGSNFQKIPVLNKA